MRWYHVPFVLLALAPAAPAGPLPDGGVTADDVDQVMRDKGFETEVAADKQGDPLIRSAWKGSKFLVFFYGCKRNKQCDSIEFSARFITQDVPAAKIADWNRTKRFGRAYLDDDLNPWVEMDLDLEFGATTEAIANDLDRWAGVIGDFNKFLHQ